MSDVYALPWHPAADIFPMLFGKDLEDLARDIQANGLREPIVVYERAGKQSVLDGRSRLAACRKIGVEPTCVIWSGDDPIGYAASANLRRRHLTETQRSFLAIEIERLYGLEERRRGRPKKGATIITHGRGDFPTRDRHEREANARAGAQVGVSRTLVARAKRLQSEAAPAIATAARAGKITVNDAMCALGYSDERQLEALALVEAGEARTLKEAFAKGDGTAVAKARTTTAGKTAGSTRGQSSRPVVGGLASSQTIDKSTTARFGEPPSGERRASAGVPNDPAAATSRTRFMSPPPADDMKADRQLLEEIWRRVVRLSRVGKDMLHRDLGRHLADLDASNLASTSARRRADVVSPETLGKSA